MLAYATLATARTRRTYSAEDRQISRATSAMTGIAVGFTLDHGGDGPARSASPTCPASRRLPSRSSAALLYLGVLVVHLLVIGRYRLLELDLRLRRNVQYLVVSSAWTTLIVGAGLFFWWRMMHLELPLPNIRLTSDALEVLPTPVDAARRAVIEKGVLIAAARRVRVRLPRAAQARATGSSPSSTTRRATTIVARPGSSATSWGRGWTSTAWPTGC